MGKIFANHISDKGHIVSIIYKEHLQSSTTKRQLNLKKEKGISLVAQWLRIRLPMQGTRVRALVREDPTCCGATKPMRHNY